MCKALLFLLLFYFCSVAGAAEPMFWPHGSAEYTDKATWKAQCKARSIDGKYYRIGHDIVACVTKTPDGKPYNLVMSYAGHFPKQNYRRCMIPLLGRIYRRATIRVSNVYASPADGCASSPVR